LCLESISSHERSHTLVALTVQRVQEKPVLRCEVEFAEEEVVDEGALEGKAATARNLFADLVRLNAAIKDMDVRDTLAVRTPHATRMQFRMYVYCLL
jgi:hypothetical protein